MKIICVCGKTTQLTYDDSEKCIGGNLYYYFGKCDKCKREFKLQSLAYSGGYCEFCGDWFFDDELIFRDDTDGKHVCHKCNEKYPISIP